MTHKSTLITLGIVIVLGGIIYITLPKKEMATPPSGTNTEETQAISDTLVDTLVDELSREETAAAEATIDQISPPSQEGIADTINTNF